MSAIDKFDELTAIVRLTLFLYENPKSNISEMISKTTAGQKAVYSAKKFLEDNNLLEFGVKTTLPYNAVFSLNEKGKKIAKALEEIKNTLES